MTFRASSVVPADAYTRIKRAAVNLRANALQAITTLAASDADYSYIRSVYQFLFNANAFFDDLKTTPGLVAYARDQENDQAYDIVAEFNTMQTALANALGWMDSNVPTSVTATPTTSWPTDEKLIATTFTPAQTAGLRTQIQSVADTIS